MPSAAFSRAVAGFALACAIQVTAPVAAHADAPRRIVSIGGAVTEILYALGADEAVAAVDTTSTFPPAAHDKPDVGYMRALSAEGTLSVGPDLVLAEEGAGPPEAIAVLKAAVRVATIPNTPTVDGVVAKIRAVGDAVDRTGAAETLARGVERRFAALASDVARVERRKRVLFLLSASGGRLMAGGRGSTADAIIRLAGGVNAADAMDGFKPMVDEAVMAAAPDVIVMMSRGEHAMTPDALFALPALAGTPAATGRALIVMDGLYLLGFGPRTPDAARDLAAALYPDVVPASAPR